MNFTNISKLNSLFPTLSTKFQPVVAGLNSTNIYKRQYCETPEVSEEEEESEGEYVKTAIVMMNLGGPEKPSDVHSFLLNLFSDKDLIPLPFQSVLSRFIAWRRTPKIKWQYQSIGGSPIKMWSNIQGEALVAHLDKMSPETAPHKHYLAFRYASPQTEDALKAMKKDNVKRAVVFSQYPQYSCSTFGSSFNQLYKDLKKSNDNEIEWSFIDRWPKHYAIIETFANKIEKFLQEFYKDDNPEAVTLLFSAHSLPMSVVNRGDPYPDEVRSTVEAVTAKLREKNITNECVLSWQSKVGPLPWLTPSTEQTVKDLGKQKKNIIVIPIAFTSDHIETLFEIDIEYQELADSCGVPHFDRIESLNGDKHFLKDSVSTESLFKKYKKNKGLADIVYDHLSTKQINTDKDEKNTGSKGIPNRTSPNDFLRSTQDKDLFEVN